jgi:hypothetical protein
VTCNYGVPRSGSRWFHAKDALTSPLRREWRPRHLAAVRGCAGHEPPAASYLLARFHRGSLWPWGRFLVNTPTVIATVDAAVVAAIAVLAARAVEATTTAVVVAGTAAFLLLWTALLRLERQTLDALAQLHLHEYRVKVAKPPAPSRVRPLKG